MWPWFISNIGSLNKLHVLSFRLTIQGQRIIPRKLQDLDEASPLYEEVIIADGSLEEFFAFDNMWG